MGKSVHIQWKKWFVAITTAIILHLASYQIFPYFLYFNKIEKLKDDFIEIELVESQQKEKQFVEVNEQAPENLPDQTDSYSFQDQQAANPETTSDQKRKVPEIVDGDQEAHKIIEGKVDPTPQPVTPGIFQDIDDSSEISEESGSPQILAKISKEQLPIEAKDGEGVFAKAEKGEEDKNNLIKKTIDLTPMDPNLYPLNSVDPNRLKNLSPKPKPRPKLDLSKISGPIRKSDLSTSRIGSVAIDAKFSKFGEYKQRMFEAIVNQWHKLAERITLGTEDLPSEVEIHFEINFKGEISNLKQFRSTTGMLASFICEDAIKSRAPYGEWSKDMIQNLGNQTEIKITFNYR